MSTDLTTTNQNNTLALLNDAQAIKDFRDKMENFTSRLNLKPKKEWVQKHEGYEYIPISFIEKELDRLYFGCVQYEILSTKQIFNEIEVVARIKVFHPVLLSWLNYDGIGASVIQQDAKTPISEFMNFKKGNALKLACPVAYAEAKKNAAKQIGKRFGADLNRKDGKVGDYEPFNKEQSATPIKIQNSNIEIKSKADVLRAYAQQQITTEEYNELLTQFPDSLN
jgi:hypothetical protein